jgi:hypothetical protein
MSGRKGEQHAAAAPLSESPAVPNGQETTDKPRAKTRSRRTNAPANMANKEALPQGDRQPPTRRTVKSPETQAAGHDVGRHMQTDVKVSNLRRSGLSS